MRYFSRAILDASNSHANRLLQQVVQNNYREHQLLWQLFPEDADASRDFIYRSQQHLLRRVYYVVSDRKPKAALGWDVASKSYSPKLIEGAQLAFSLRVNPIVTRKDSAGKRHRHDVVMDAKRTMNYKQQQLPDRKSTGQIIQQAGIDWLTSRSEKYGFEINEKSMVVESYDQHRSYKSRSKMPIQYSTMDVAGTLEVGDVEKFSNALMSGIGPAKAFGCGLMLVRRI